MFFSNLQKFQKVSLHNHSRLNLKKLSTKDLNMYLHDHSKLYISKELTVENNFNIKLNDHSELNISNSICENIIANLSNHSKLNIKQGSANLVEYTLKDHSKLNTKLTTYQQCIINTYNHAYAYLGKIINVIKGSANGHSSIAYKGSPKTTNLQKNGRHSKIKNN